MGFPSSSWIPHIYGELPPEDNTEQTRSNPVFLRFRHMQWLLRYILMGKASFRAEGAGRDRREEAEEIPEGPTKGDKGRSI